MRMVDIPDDGIAALTGTPRVGHLATSHDEKPHVAPTWFVYNDDAIELVTTGRKLADIRRNPRVAFSLQADEAGDPLWGLAIHGTARIVDGDDAAAIHDRIERRYDTEGVDDYDAEHVPVRISIGSLNYWTYE